MQTVHDICSVAAALAGELAQEQQEVLYSLCKAAASELRLRLRSGVSPEDCYEAFVCAAAYLALSRFYTAAEGDISAFEAGAIKISKVDAAQTAQRLARTAEQLLSAYVTSPDFVFRRVRV